MSSHKHSWRTGPALGIGRECGGLGPLPVGGPIFLFYMWGCI